MPKRKPKDRQRSPDLPQNWIERHIERLAAFCLHDPIPLTDWDYKRSKLVGPASYEPVDADWSAIRLGETWGGPGVTAHFRRRITIPESHAGGNACLDIDLDGGETQLSVNGRLWQGLDRFRSLAPLGEHAVAGAELLLEMEAFVINYPYDKRSGDERDLHTFKRAELVLRDSVIEACLFDFSLSFDAYMHLWETDSETELEEYLLHCLESACRLLGPEFRSREHAREVAAAASELLRERVFQCSRFRRPGLINAHAHSHLDIVYLWPVKETLRKNGRTVSNALSLLREYPDYVYSQSQPWLYEKLGEHYPALLAEVKSMIDAGRWEAVGATYVEPDGNLPGAESWVRQILFGKRLLRNALGVDSRICWLPDVFGVLYTLPQILKKSGVDYFMTAKLNIWNDTTDFPHDSFRWRGPDGSEVVTHFPPTHFAQDFNFGNLRRNWRDYREKQTTRENLYIYGWGDGGGGPTRQMVEFSQRARRFPGLPDVATSKAEPFFDRLAENWDTLPVWDDELYMEGHRGAYTSRADLKRNNRKAELLYRDVEILSAIASAFGGPRIQDRLNEGWKLLLLNQFHDTLPGTHVPEAVADSERDYAAVFSIGREIRDELFEHIQRQLAAPADLLVFNTLGERAALASVEDAGDFCRARLSTGEELASQFHDGRLYFRVNLPSMGWVSVNLARGESAQAPETAVFDDNGIDTEFYRIDFDDDGNLRRIHDKINDREVLSGPGNEFQVFEDDPGEKFAAWDIAYHIEEYRYPVRQTSGWRMVANGPLFARFQSTWRVLNSNIEQEMVLYAHDPRIDFHTRVEWRDAKKLLKVAFPLNVRSRTATYDLPFGHIERPAHRNTRAEQAKFEVSGHKWADMSEGDYGVALLNDCKYGYDAHDNVLRLSLLRSPVYPHPGSDIGEHRFSCALLPHAGGWRQANVDKAGYAFNCPPLVARRARRESPAGSAPADYSLLELDGDSALVEVVKQAEDGDGLILRVFDSHGTHKSVGVSVAAPLTRIEETDLLEERPVPVAGADGFAVRFTPYEIKTFRLAPESASVGNQDSEDRP